MNVTRIDGNEHVGKVGGMRTYLWLAVLVVVPVASGCVDDDGPIECGAGTHLEGSVCVLDDADGDADTDADADADGDSDADADADADGDSDADADADADGDADTDADADADADADGDYALSFEQILLPRGDDPHPATIGDVNADGASDVLVANVASDDVRLWIGDGTGALEDSGTVEVEDSPYRIASSDLDGDGDADAVTVGGGWATVLLSDGAGAFSTDSYRLSDEPDCVAWSGAVGIGDVEGDGYLDIISMSECDLPNPIGVVLSGDGSGSFSETSRFRPSIDFSDYVGTSPVLLDVDGDGRLDLVVTSSLVDYDLMVCWGNGEGFDDAVRITTFFGGAGSPLVMDWTGDGNLDLLYAGFEYEAEDFHHITDALGVWAGDGSRSFPDWQGLDLPFHVGLGWAVALDDDAHMDAAFLWSDRFTAMRRDGAGGSLSQSETVLPFRISLGLGVAIGELNGDSRADVVLPDGDADQILVLLSR